MQPKNILPLLNHQGIMLHSQQKRLCCIQLEQNFKRNPVGTGYIFFTFSTLMKLMSI